MSLLHLHTNTFHKYYDVQNSFSIILELGQCSSQQAVSHRSRPFCSHSDYLSLDAGFVKVHWRAPRNRERCKGVVENCWRTMNNKYVTRPLWLIFFFLSTHRLINFFYYYVLTLFWLLCVINDNSIFYIILNTKY